MTEKLDQNNNGQPTDEVMLQARLIEACELQFRLASAVRIATTNGNQPLDLPSSWSHGKHTLEYEEIALTPEQANGAAFYLQRASTYMMAVQIKDAMIAIYKDLKNHKDDSVRAAYQISRMIRNSFVHRLLKPVWSIDKDCRGKTFEIRNVIKLVTTNLNGKEFDWRDYGGPLAILKMSRFVRKELLKCPDQLSSKDPDDLVRKPGREMIQQGNLILTKVDEIPAGARKLNIEPLPDGGIPLGNGHILYPKKEE